jgi:hypothetical protein
MKSKKINKKKQFLLIVLFFSFVFFLLGSWFQRYEWDKKISKFTNKTLETITSHIYSPFVKKNKITIDINFSNYEKLGRSKIDFVKNGKASSNMQIKVPAKIRLNNEKVVDTKISIKGTHSDHWERERKWSFKLNLKSNSRILGKEEFALQHPATRGYLYEWIFMKFLEHENLISHKIDFLELVINGENLGLYNFTEAHTKQLLEKNKRIDGPIVFYDKQHWVKETSQINNLGANDYKDSFNKAPIGVVNSSEWLVDVPKKKLLNKAINLLELFRNETLLAHEVFDVEQMAKVFAIKAILGAVEFDWKDIKFYYNPKTSKLEPIGREVHVDLNQTNHEVKTWWVNINSSDFVHSKDQESFIALFYKDKIFKEYYLKELNKLADFTYYKSIINVNINEFNKFKSLLIKYFPHENIYSEKKIISQIKFIQDTLNPIREINAYFIEEKENYVYLNIENLQKLPIRIIGLEFANSKIEIKKDNYIIDGFGSKRKDVNILKFKCNANNKCFDIKNKKQTVTYNILGQEKLKREVIMPWSNIKSN